MESSARPPDTASSSAVAGPSKPLASRLAPPHSSPRNPQLGPEPWFAYPIPEDENIEEELPPYFEGENVPMGPMLERLVRRSYGDMGILLTQTLPRSTPRQKPRHVIDYAKHTRQAVLKYLAVLRWKTAVDVPLAPASSASSSSSQPAQDVNGNSNGNGNAQPSFPTPHSNVSNGTSPGAYVGKGKGRMVDEEVQAGSRAFLRGKVTDAKRIQQFMQHQNKQHEEAVAHVRHTAKMIEGLRERNPDLLTAISLLTNGTYDRLPISLTEPFLPRPPLTNRSILDTLRRLNALIQYRLRCVDYVPPELAIDRVADGRAYLHGAGKNGWRAELSLVAFGEDSRWWLTGLDWGWRAKEKGTDDPGGDASDSSSHPDTGWKRFTGEERQQILDLVNGSVLSPRDNVEGSRTVIGKGTSDSARLKTPIPSNGHVRADMEVAGEAPKRVADAPLVRLYNFIQHLSLSYRLEVLFSQAMALSRGKWRNQLLVEIDRSEKLLKLKYWVRQKPPSASQQPSNRRQQTSQTTAGTRQIIGGTLRVALAEGITGSDEIASLLRQVGLDDEVPVERILNLGLQIRWEVGDAGLCAGLKLGDALDSSDLQESLAHLDIEDVLLSATRYHASLLTRQQTASIMATPPSLIAGRMPPMLVESDISTSARPLSLRIPLPSRLRDSNLIVGVSSITGLIEIEDDGARLTGGANGLDDRTLRARMTTNNVNEGKSRLLEDISRLIAAIVMENLEAQMKQLGWSPVRRLPMRSADLAKSDLLPASTIFVPLPSSSLHYLVGKLTPLGISFELLRLARVPADSGIGIKLAVRDRSPMDLAKLKARRHANGEERIQTQARNGDPVKQEGMTGFEVENRDLKDLFIYCNALVAITIVEQQLKDRSIPFAQQFPPTTGPGAPASRSAVAGMVPTIVVSVKDLLKDDKMADVAMPKVFMQIKDWWNGGKCQVVTVLQLRHRSTLPSSGASPGLSSATASSTARAEGITFDQASSIVRFSAEDISRCVPAFLAQWERLSKVIVVAGEVNRLNKHPQFHDLRMLSFDLRTATFSYSPGFNASITYSPTSDSYEATFFRTSSANMTSSTTPGTSAGAPDATPRSLAPDAVASPHELIGGLLSHRLNELVSGGHGKGGIGREFITLLRNTLPVLLEIESIRPNSTGGFPALVIIAVDTFRLVWDHAGKRYAMDINLVQHDRYILSDASAPQPDGLIDLSCGSLTPIPSFEDIVSRCYTTLKGSVAVSVSVSASPSVSTTVPAAVPMSPSIPATVSASRPNGKTKSGSADGGGGGTVLQGGEGQKSGGREGREVLGMKLDGGKSLMCSVRVVSEVIRGMSGEVDRALGLIVPSAT